MIVVADTSPLNYLLLLRNEWVLPELYQRVILPGAVVRELQHPSAPKVVALWSESFPAWVKIADGPLPEDASLLYLGDGEREAIALAKATSPDRLLMDDLEGRIEAERRGIQTTGTLGVLLAADRARLLRGAEVYRRLLQETNFRCSLSVETAFLAQLQER